MAGKKKKRFSFHHKSSFSNKKVSYRIPKYLPNTTDKEMDYHWCFLKLFVTNVEIFYTIQW